ncbi:NAD(P)H-dependent oxidoreductase [Novosphingobium sp. RD2P27]|uniref:NAD(P)H-dependent oxidoreductase n=1 Tax=Novosphingobium kalidii TaxID=3230299 RepID=A0ABV2D1K5_9SPHN
MSPADEFERIRRERIDEGEPQMTTMIFLFHPDLSRSRANAALAKAVAGQQRLEVVDMTALYPMGIDMERDGECEAARLLGADRIVLQFPMQWYSTPPLLKAWQDAVLTRMGYIYPETEGAGLAGKPIMIATTMGAAEETYRCDGRNRVTVPELLAPLRATANRLAMDWCDPFLVYNADGLDAPALAEAEQGYRDALSCFAELSSRAKAT